MSHPYQDLAQEQYWKSAMAEQAPGLVDPARASANPILAKDKVVSLGSCFAQHLGRHLQLAGLNYWVPESAPKILAHAEALDRQYGLYSARYGNVYTPAQAVQLLERALGHFTPVEHAWLLGDRYVDPFRPRVEPGGFASVDALLSDQGSHLAFVREAFTQAKHIIFTLGLTEAWQNKGDGAIYPLAPGVAGGQFDAERYAFVRFGVAQLIADLRRFRGLIHGINPVARIILTVSPVPLAATFAPEHVWSATSYSKAALRVAAQVLSEQYENTEYFAAYEIITSPLNEGRYWQDDFRGVNEAGVHHVMRSFFKAYTEVGHATSLSDDRLFEDMALVCDEDAITDSGLAAPPTKGDGDAVVCEGGFNEAAYLRANPDVAAAVREGQLASGTAHYEQYGRFEGRLLGP